MLLMCNLNATFDLRAKLNWFLVWSKPAWSDLWSQFRSDFMIDVINRKLAALVLPDPLGDLLDGSPHGQLVQLRRSRDSRLDAHVFAGSAARTTIKERNLVRNGLLHSGLSNATMRMKDGAQISRHR